MSEDTPRQVISITCPNKDCRNSFKMYRPEKPGLVRVTCPQCKQAFQVKVGAPPPPAGVSSDNSQAMPRHITLPSNTEDVYKFMCPHCSSQGMAVKGSGKNLVKTGCPKCKGRVDVIIDRNQQSTELVGGDDEDDFSDPAEEAPSKAAIRVFTKRRFLPDAKTDYPLKKGVYIIGRDDPDNPPEIPIAGDSTVSRRSVQVEVVEDHGNGETLYPLTVLKATNPVSLNGKRLREGDNVFLSFNDRLTMGKTEIVFIKYSRK